LHASRLESKRIVPEQEQLAPGGKKSTFLFPIGNTRTRRVAIQPGFSAHATSFFGILRGGKSCAAS